MKRLVSPFALLLILSVLSLGWRATPADRMVYPISMTLADNRLYVSGGHSGLHVYDVTDPAAPGKVIHIPLDFNASTAVKDDIVYANDGGQLQAIRISGDSYTVVAKIGVKLQFHDVPSPGVDDESFSCMCTTNTFDAASVSPPATASSFSAFALVDDRLYRADDNGSIIVYDVSVPDTLTLVSDVPVGWDIETLHPSGELLFVGGFNGMYIFDREDPDHPRQLSKIQHVRACDPVVVSGSTAYVTLRGGNACGLSPDELLCVSIADPGKPEVVGEKPLNTPYGLAAQNARVYVSHGIGGYSLVDASDPANVTIEKTWSGALTRDFIWSGNTLFVLTDDNVNIYDVADPLAPKLLSQVQGPSS
ncbi:MAG TPA: hypothetical protein VF247_10140 [Candidatus Krumholzibacteria bacterium]